MDNSFGFTYSFGCRCARLHFDIIVFGDTVAGCNGETYGDLGIGGGGTVGHGSQEAKNSDLKKYKM